MVPSLKGLAIAGLVADLNALESGGAATRDELAKHLDSDQLAVLDDFDGFRWYPVPIYEALVEALVRLTGTADAGTSPWLRARGAAAAQRLLERGLYQQLNSLTETDSWTTENQISRVRMIASLQGSLLNFTVWKVDTDPD
jgi:hypothetical protein